MTTILFLLCIFASCILQGITGFGFALLAAPLVLLFYDQQTTVVVLTLVSFVLNFFLIKKIKAEVDKTLIIKILGFGFVGVFMGVLALVTINPNILKLIACILASIFSLVLFSPRNKIAESNGPTFSAGLITGFLQSSIGLSGFPLVLILTGYGLEIKKMRRTLAIIFFFLSVFSLPLFLWKNILTWDRFILGLFCIPLVIIGGNIGNWISDKVPAKFFRLLSLVLILAVSLQIITKVLTEWKIL
jgi:hypothetical protein